jgi:N-ethylmaleimide reductase
MNPQPLLFSPTKLGRITLKNRVAMAPMTRSRAGSDHVPTSIMAEYYRQRAGAGLIITEGTSPSRNGTGYARIPGLYTNQQVEAWKPVTAAVHSEGGAIFVQLMHTGRVSHPANMEDGAEILAPSAIQLPGQMWTDGAGMQAHPVPREMSAADVEVAILEFVRAARNAIEAGFDGVEIHGANGYLIEQFLRPNTNRRTDAFGGGIEGRARFLLEIVRRTGEAIGFDRVGVRLSPFGTFNGIDLYPEMEADAVHVARELSRFGIVYLHVLDHSPLGAPEFPRGAKAAIREAFAGTLILAGGYDAVKGETELRSGLAQLISIGRPYISNPDLVERLERGAPLADPDPSTFYTPGEKGYVDYTKSA